MANLGDFVSNPPTERAKGLLSIKGEAVSILGVTFRLEGKHPYVVMHVKGKDGNIRFVKTTAKHIILGLIAAKEANVYPLDATFVQVSKVWVVKK